MKRVLYLLVTACLVFGTAISVAVSPAAAACGGGIPCPPTPVPPSHNPGDPDGDGIPNGIDQCPEQAALPRMRAVPPAPGPQSFPSPHRHHASHPADQRRVCWRPAAIKASIFASSRPPAPKSSVSSKRSRFTRSMVSRMPDGSGIASMTVGSRGASSVWAETVTQCQMLRRTTVRSQRSSLTRLAAMSTN